MNTNKKLAARLREVAPSYPRALQVAAIEIADRLEAAGSSLSEEDRDWIATLRRGREVYGSYPGDIGHVVSPADERTLEVIDRLLDKIASALCEVSALRSQIEATCSRAEKAEAKVAAALAYVRDEAEDGWLTVYKGTLCAILTGTGAPTEQGEQE